MVQRLFIELLLFLTPFMVFLVYRAASRDMKIRDRWPLTTLVLVGAGLAVAGLVVGPLLQPSESNKCFRAAQYIDGKTIPSEEIPCEEATPPGQVTTPDSGEPARPPPVAPRDRELPPPTTPPEPQAPG
jgi:hypothetical protein